MSRYIDADDFKREMEKYLPDDRELALKVLKSIKTADAHENVHAHWTFRQLGGWHCSKCDEQAPFWCMANTQNLSNFCPKCGAVMDERSENEETN